MISRFSLLAVLFLLSACAYVADKNYQEMRIETPGAQGAVCFVYIDKLKYKYHPPQTITVTNSMEDLEIDCLAPGNRRKKLLIEPKLSRYTAANAVNGFLGVIWDGASGALYKYPEIVYVDFSEMDPLPSALPAHNNPDIKQPEEYLMEEFRPGVPRMNSDADYQPQVLKRRVRGGDQSSYGESGYIGEGEGGASGKSNLQDVQSEGSTSQPSAMGPVRPSADAPTPLYPGE